MLHSFLNFRQLKSENAVEILGALPSSNDHLSKTSKFSPLRYNTLRPSKDEYKSDANSANEF